MKSGDWIKINFLGKLKATGEVFDLTKESDARENGIHDEKKKYGPVLIIVGGGFIIPGVERELLSMSMGETKEFDVSPNETVGPRKPELLKVISIAKFTKQKITPFPGLVLNVDGRNAKVLAVSGGRVRMDFNHPIAGKELHYTVEVVEEITDTKKRIESLMDYYGLIGKMELLGKKVTITPDKDTNAFVKKIIEETLKKWCTGIDAVEFKSKDAGAAKPKAKAGEPAPGAEKPATANNKQPDQ